MLSFIYKLICGGWVWGSREFWICIQIHRQTGRSKLCRCKSDPVKTAISRHDCKNCSLFFNEACGKTWNIYDDIEVNRRGTQKLCRRGFVSPKAKLSSGLPLCATWQWMKNHVKREIIFDMKIFPSIDQFVLNFIDFIKADAKHGSLVSGNKNKQI